MFELHCFIIKHNIKLDRNETVSSVGHVIYPTWAGSENDVV